MRRYSVHAALGLAVLLTACHGGGPLGKAEDDLAAKNWVSAEWELDKLADLHPDSRRVHLDLFVLYRYLSVQGDAISHETYLRKALGAYAWLVQAYGLTENYGAMEQSFESKPDADYDFAEVHRLLYGE